MILRFTIPGKPKVLIRARKGRGGHWYDPSAEDKKLIAQLALESRVAHKKGLLSGSLRMEVKYYGMRPNADLSNGLKLVEDALNGVLYADDKQIDHAVIWRMPKDGTDPRTEVMVEELEKLWWKKLGGA